jgi:serine/threonine protein kinase
MPSRRNPIDVDFHAAPFDRYAHIQPIAADRSGHASTEHVRHQLLIGRDKTTRANVLIKLTSKAGLVYQNNLLNEIATLTTIQRELPLSPYFPDVLDHGRLHGGRVYLTMTLFDELPLALSIGTERVPARLVGYLRTTIEVAKALSELHRLNIFHVDLNPMNILYRIEKGKPVIRIVDFESSYELARHSAGVFYDPPTTPGYSAPEVTKQAPDARSDLFSLGAVLYTMLAGYQPTFESNIHTRVDADAEIDSELKDVLLEAVDPDPDGRYPSLQEFVAALSNYLERIWPGRSW